MLSEHTSGAATVYRRHAAALPGVAAGAVDAVGCQTQLRPRAVLGTAQVIRAVLP